MPIFLALLIALGASVPPPPERSVPRHETIKPFYVAGYEVRTRNADEMSGRGRIGPLWQRFVAENLGARIPRIAGSPTIVVYSGYASDEKGEYDYLLGAPVSSVEDLPDGMTWREVRGGDYAVLTTAQGPLPAVLQDQWRRIWQMSAAELGGRRAFLTDYEVYGQPSADPGHAEVEIHIGLK